MSEKNKHREKNETLIMGDMEAGHLMEDAEKWWDKSGKDILRNRQFSGSAKDQQAAMDATNPAHPNYIGNSNILMGAAWIMLRPEERNRVVMAYTLTLKGYTI